METITTFSGIDGIYSEKHRVSSRPNRRRYLPRLPIEPFSFVTGLMAGAFVAIAIYRSLA